MSDSSLTAKPQQPPVNELGWGIGVLIVVAIITVLAMISIGLAMLANPGIQDRAVRNTLNSTISSARMVAATNEGVYPQNVAEAVDIASFETVVGTAVSTSADQVSMQRVNEQAIVIAIRSDSGACLYAFDGIGSPTFYGERDADGPCDAATPPVSIIAQAFSNK